MSELISIGIAYDTSQLVTGSRQVTEALRQVEQADKGAQTATKELAQSNTQAAQAMGQESQAARQAASATQTMEQAARQAAQATQQEAQAASAAASALTKTASAASQAAQATGSVSQSATQATSALAAMAQQALAFGAAQVGIASLREAFTTVKEALVGTVQAAIKMESMTATFKVISGSVQAASADIGFLRQTAERLGISFTDSAKGFQTMAAAAQNTRLAGQGVRDIYTAIAEKGRVLGSSAQDIQGAMLAVSQSFSKGVIQAEELRGQFSERMPGAINEMARALGVGTAELGKMMERGQLGIDAWQKWAQVVRQDLAGATQEASRTAGAAIERLGNAMRELQVAVGQYIVPALTTTVNMLTSVAQWATTAMNALGRYDEARKKAAQDIQAVASKGEPGAAGRYGELIQQAADYDAMAKRLRTPIVSKEGELSLGALFSVGGEEKAAQYEASARAARKEAEALLATTRAIGDEDKRRQTQSAMDNTRIQQKNTFLEAGQKLLEQQRKEQEAMASATRTGLGRDPTAEEKVKLQDKQLKDAQEFLQTNSALAEQYKNDPVVKALRERGQATEAATRALEDAKKDKKDADREAKAAEKEQERLDKERRSNVMATGKLVLDGYEKEGDLIGQLHERVRALTMTEEERLALQVAGIEDPTLRAYAEELVKQVEAAKDFNDQLRERNKLLGEQATASKATLDDITRLEKQLEPRRRGMSRAEQLAATREELARVTPAESRGEVLQRADEQIARTLAAEKEAQMLGHLNDMADELTATFVDMAVTGEINFKKLSESFSRMVLDMVADAIDLKGAISGWLKQGMHAAGGGQGGWLSSLFTTGGGAGSAALQTDISTSMAANPALFAFGGGMQAGGPVWSDRAYMVGERGPELFVPRASGTIVPHGGAGGGNPVTVNMVVNTRDADSFRRSGPQIAAQMTRAAQQARRVM